MIVVDTPGDSCSIYNGQTDPTAGLYLEPADGSHRRRIDGSAIVGWLADNRLILSDGGRLLYDATSGRTLMSVPALSITAGALHQRQLACDLVARQHRARLRQRHHHNCRRHHRPDTDNEAAAVGESHRLGVGRRTERPLRRIKAQRSPIFRSLIPAASRVLPYGYRLRSGAVPLTCCSAGLRVHARRSRLDTGAPWRRSHHTPQFPLDR